jgi:uncharacterized protein
MVIIKRKLLDELKEHLKREEISLITGPRQTGKTTLMNLLKEHVEKGGWKTLFLNLDSEMDRPVLDSQHALVKKVNLELGNKKGCVFIDEIQRKQNAGLFLKGIYDSKLPHKFIVSGSGSLELKEKIHESLTGRKRIFELSTVSFAEFINFKTGYKYENDLQTPFDAEKTRTESFFEEHLNFGGYPKVVLEVKLKEKTALIDEIFHSYLEKDISHLLNVEKVESFSELIKVMAQRPGQITNCTELSSVLGISLPTLKNYLSYAEKTFIVDRITPYFRNIRKEISKAPVFYFKDTGLRNYSVGRFGSLHNTTDAGSVFENFVYNILREKLKLTPASLHFWRTTDKAEVDFIINTGKEILPFEVKFSRMKKSTLGRSLKSFISKYSPKRAYIINTLLDKRIKEGNTEVFILPYWRLFGKDFRL